jgi:hypothetical protein
LLYGAGIARSLATHDVLDARVGQRLLMLRVAAIVLICGAFVACRRAAPPRAAVAAPPRAAVKVPEPSDLPSVRLQREFLQAQTFVSVKGRVERPAGALGALRVQLTDGDCFTRQHVLVDSLLSVGIDRDHWATYSASAIVGNGSRVRACVAIIGAGKATTWYGASRGTPAVDRDHAQFDGYDVVLAKGAPIELL